MLIGWVSLTGKTFATSLSRCGYHEQCNARVVEITDPHHQAGCNWHFEYRLFLNGLAKGGLTLLVLDMFLGGNWVGHHTWASIGIAFLVGGVLIPIPCAYLISKEDDARRAAARRPR
jgi:hypothetical protein